MAANKDFKPIIRELRAQGWEVEPTSQGHYRARPPDQTRQIVHFSMSNDPRALKNTLSNLRASGFRWEEPERRATPETREQTPRAPAATPAPAEPAEPDMDQLFESLKAAKVAAQESSELEKLAVQELARAENQLRQAQRDRAAAEASLREAKQAFDQAFDSQAA